MDQFIKALIQIGIDLAMGGELSQAVESIQKGVDILSQTEDVRLLKWSRDMLSKIKASLAAGDDKLVME